MQALHWNGPSNRMALRHQYDGLDPDMALRPMQFKPRCHHVLGWQCLALRLVWPWQQHGPHTSTWPPTMAQTIGIHGFLW